MMRHHGSLIITSGHSTPVPCFPLALLIPESCLFFYYFLSFRTFFSIFFTISISTIEFQFKFPSAKIYFVYLFNFIFFSPSWFTDSPCALFQHKFSLSFFTCPLETLGTIPISPISCYNWLHVLQTTLLCLRHHQIMFCSWLNINQFS